MIKILQVCPSMGLSCGVNFFSKNLEDSMSEFCDIETKKEAENLENFDCCVVHYTKHIGRNDVERIQKKIPLVIFVHHEREEKELIAGRYVILNSSARTKYQNLVVPHPCFTRDLTCRKSLKKKFGLDGKIVIGTCGFINAKRRLADICNELVKHLDDRYVINLSCCRHFLWDSEPILSELARIPKNRLRLTDRQLAHSEMNEQMQMCDLVWCWTDAVQENYGSGVASDLYGSGTKMVIQDRPQHQHVFGKKSNVIVVKNDFGQFLDVLKRECMNMDFPRLIDESISWKSVSKKIFRFATQKIL